MKNKLEQIIRNLFSESIFRYYENYDDVYSGFEFNPNDPRTMIRVLFTPDAIEQQPDASISIDYFMILPYKSSILSKDIIRGKMVLTESGYVDYIFYETILANWRLFI